jgi:G3E family GTPase
VETIENRRQKLEEILPEARIAVAHGQMPERELERVMRDFVAQRYQPAAVLHHHRDRHRRAHRQHHRHQRAPTSSAWPSCTSCAGA